MMEACCEHPQDFLVMIRLPLCSDAPTDVRVLFPPLAGKKVTVRAPAPALASLTKPRPSSRSLLGNIKRGVGASKMKKCAFASNRKSVGEVQERPLRERVTHLLALRPYKRPELILRLQKDGLTAADKDTLDSVLSEVNHALLTPDKYRSESKALYSQYMHVRRTVGFRKWGIKTKIHFLTRFVFVCLYAGRPAQR